MMCLKTIRLFAFLSATVFPANSQTATRVNGAVDLNSFVTPGRYLVENDAAAMAGTNYPSREQGILAVEGTNDPTYSEAGSKFQTYQTRYTNIFFVRSLYGGNWGPWVQLVSYTTSQTAMGIGDNSDLNTFFTPGRYIVGKDSWASASHNYPEQLQQGVLTVQATGSPQSIDEGSRFQSYQTKNGHLYLRSAYGGNWQPWSQIGETSSQSLGYLPSWGLDLNDVVVSGTYYRNDPNNYGHTGYNFPAGAAMTTGILTVVNTNGHPNTYESMISQTYMATGGGIYTRFFSVNSWSPWTTWSASTGNGSTAPAAGSDGQLQFNAGGAFGSSASLSWDNNSNGGKGSLSIGQPAAATGTYGLNVKGNIRADKLTVNSTGADFVFARSYKLKPLTEVEEYVKRNQHLPDITPAAEIQKEGIDVGESQTKLLQKIEELTLYIIQQNKALEEQDKRISGLEARQRKNKHALLPAR